MSEELERVKSEKQIELEKLNKENQELDKLAEQLGEVEKRIQKERIDQAIMSEDVENVLNELAGDRQKREEKEAKRIAQERDMKKKKLEEEARKLEEEFSNKVYGSVSENAKLFGYLKRYIIIGLVTGIPGIAISYLYDRWEENQMVHDLYEAHIDMIQNPNNVELERIYQKKKLEFSRVYNIEKIEKVIKASDVISKIKTDKDELTKLKNEIEKARGCINQKLDEAIEKEARLQEENEQEQIACEEEIEEELERVPPSN